MVLLTTLIQTTIAFLELGEVNVCTVIKVPLFRDSVCDDQLYHLKMVGRFHIAKDLFITIK